jgi:energy-converting hydrogenase Eha subunit E
MLAPEGPQHNRDTIVLALLDSLTAGMALGYLAHQHREALVAHSGTIGLTTVVLIGALTILWVSVRVLSRANRRIEAIFADELRDRSGEPKI